MNYIELIDNFSPENLRATVSKNGLTNKKAWELMNVSKPFFYGLLNGKYVPSSYVWEMYLLELHARKIGYKSLVDLVEFAPAKKNKLNYFKTKLLLKSTT